MDKVNRGHLAGLLAYKELCASGGYQHMTWAEALDHLIAQASAAHEQQPVGYADPKSFDNFKNLSHLGGLYLHEWMWAKPAPGLVALYTHADDAERERLRAELASLRRWESNVRENSPLLNELEKSRQQLAKARALLSDIYSAFQFNGQHSTLVDKVREYLFATAQPAECGAVVNGEAVDVATAAQDLNGLVEALEGMLEYFPHGHSDGECFSVEKARAALAAHRCQQGEQP